MESAQSRPPDLRPENSISIGPDQILSIQQWESGLKIYKYKSNWRKPKYLPNILVPVSEMDEVIRQLPVEEPQHPEGDKKPLILTTISDAQHYGGQQYNFELSAWKKSDKWHLYIRRVQTSEKHKKWAVHFPFSALPWVREQMVKILPGHDGSERIKEMPKIPEWATRDAPKKHCPYCTKESKCQRHMKKSNRLANRGTFRYGQRKQMPLPPHHHE